MGTTCSAATGSTISSRAKATSENQRGLGPGLHRCLRSLRAPRAEVNSASTIGAEETSSRPDGGCAEGSFRDSAVERGEDHPGRLTCGNGLGKQMEPVDQTGRCSNLLAGNFHLLMELSALRFG